MPGLFRVGKGIGGAIVFDGKHGEKAGTSISALQNHLGTARSRKAQTPAKTRPISMDRSRGFRMFTHRQRRMVASTAAAGTGCEQLVENTHGTGTEGEPPQHGAV